MAYLGFCSSDGIMMLVDTHGVELGEAFLISVARLLVMILGLVCCTSQWQQKSIVSPIVLLVTLRFRYIFFQLPLVKKTGGQNSKTTFSTLLGAESMLIRELVKNKNKR